VLRGGDAEAKQQLPRARLGRVAAVFRVLRLQIRRAQELVFPGFRIGVDRVALAHRRPHLGVALQHHVSTRSVSYANWSWRSLPTRSLESIATVPRSAPAPRPGFS